MYQDFVDAAGKIMPLDKINAYGLYHARGVFEGQTGITREKRVLNLTRSGDPGSQKYVAILSMVGRYQCDMGYSEKTGDRRHLFLRLRTSLLDSGYRSIFCKTGRTLVLERRFPGRTGRPGVSGTICEMVSVRSFSADISEPWDRLPERTMEFWKTGGYVL